MLIYPTVIIRRKLIIAAIPANGIHNTNWTIFETVCSINEIPCSIMPCRQTSRRRYWKTFNVQTIPCSIWLIIYVGCLIRISTITTPIVTSQFKSVTVTSISINTRFVVCVMNVSNDRKIWSTIWIRRKLESLSSVWVALTDWIT